MAYRWTLEDLQRVQKRKGVTTLPADSPGDPSTKSTKPSLYRNVKVKDATGAVHDSTKEFRRWQDLQLRERAGEISELRRQPVFDLIHNGVLVCKYEADASYVECATGAKVVEDTKPSDPKYRKTAAYRIYRIKAKFFRAAYGFDITEV